MRLIASGTPIPEFTLQDGLREPFTRESIEGRKVIFAFFPYAFSGLCTEQLSVYQSELVDELATADVTLYGVSVDATFSQTAFRDQLGFSFELLSDFEPKGETAKAFGAYLDGPGMSARALVAIGDDGVVKWSWVGESPREIPGSDVVREAIAAL